MARPTLVMLTRQRHRVHFASLRDAFGCLDWGTPGIITIDLSRRTQPARTYLHELIHLYEGPDCSETVVLREESRAWRRLTIADKALLYRSMVRREERCEE